MIQKSPARLLIAAIAFLLGAGACVWFFRWWLGASLSALVGGYLLVWATAGKARWCRECKTFRLTP